MALNIITEDFDNFYEIQDDLGRLVRHFVQEKCAISFTSIRQWILSEELTDWMLLSCFVHCQITQSRNKKQNKPSHCKQLTEIHTSLHLRLCIFSKIMGLCFLLSQTKNICRMREREMKRKIESRDKMKYANDLSVFNINEFLHRLWFTNIHCLYAASFYWFVLLLYLSVFTSSSHQKGKKY